VNVVRSTNGSHLSPLPSGPASGTERSILNEESFRRMISLERKRSERSRKPFVLMLLDVGQHLPSERSGKTLAKILSSLTATTRETDATGWYRDKSVVGVMFTEISPSEREVVVTTMISRVSDTLRSNLTFEQFNQLSVSFHVFPEDWDDDPDARPSNPTLYPDLSERANDRRVFNTLKRMMDVLVSSAALVMLSPVFLVIAAAVKATSPGPIFFRQRRIGQYGKSFEFLKIRSMYVNNDSGIHKEYVKSLIAGKAQANPSNGNGQGVYKLTKDPRITRVGAFLRRTSLDEIPQFINVLKGDMSLVGPRPPVPYEVETYAVWHRRRLLEAKPGITGLWQVSGRSRVKFDDMVRLDLRYARTGSLWMDVKILLRTPGAAVVGEGAL
jgi:lipopolysaccharide/colanic/teichoic acid biosynthesis glycosyltransferase